MKKAYIIPETKVIVLNQRVSLLAGSTDGAISSGTTDRAYSLRYSGLDFDESEVDE